MDAGTNGHRQWWRRTARAVAAGAAVTVLGAILGPVSQAAAAQRGVGAEAASGSLVEVIVQGSPEIVEPIVARLGGVVEHRLAVIDGLSAKVPVDGIAALRAVPGVRAVTPNGTLTSLDQRWGDDTTDEGQRASLASGQWQPDHDRGSAFNIAKDTGADAVWGKSDPHNSNRKLTGHGVGVALIDTGVSPVEGLNTPGKVVNGPDLSLDSQAEHLRHLDSYGHGTHMAGLIAGRDSAVPAGNEADAKYFVGMAPDAKVINIKAGAGDGGVDVSQVLAGIDWVVTNRASHNIRVLNLSYGTDSTQSYTLDPLAHAVENAWRAGIVVVVAAGNDGELGPRPLTMPAIDPFVIAVGSTDHRGSDKLEDERVGAWTNAGSASRRPDLIAPGKSAVSLRVPGSWADVGHPEGLVYGDVTGRLFRGTGTSQSAAVVSGAAALLLQLNPQLTPDQVKGLLKASADGLMGDNSPVQGAGELDIKGAVELLEKGAPPAYTQLFTRSTGLGSLDAARGGISPVDPATGTALTGERDIFGKAWDASAWAPQSALGTAWTGGVWRGTAWAGPTWSGEAWPTTTWTSPAWTGVKWSTRAWTRLSWRADDWSRLSWRGSDNWSRLSWRGSDWSRLSWRVADQW